MPKHVPDNKEQSEDPVEITFIENLKNQANVSFPVMICGVSRKANTGNFENIDVFAGLAVPILELPQADLEAFKQGAADAAELGFQIVSRETGDRYTRIKDLQSGQ